MDEVTQISNQENNLAETELDAASQPFVGQWNQLVSTTNWEKGRIITDWREALIDAQAPAAEYCDEAWSRRVGTVTGQHVGRLRRVHQRFGSVSEQYDGLYWSHFHSAMEWPDAEMYLEGAVQNKWSVSQMRAQRWEAIGAPPDQKPRDEDIITAELDEDVSFGLDAKSPGSRTRCSEPVSASDQPVTSTSVPSAASWAPTRTATGTRSAATARKSVMSTFPCCRR